VLRAAKVVALVRFEKVGRFFYVESTFYDLTPLQIEKLLKWNGGAIFLTNTRIFSVK